MLLGQSRPVDLAVRVETGESVLGSLGRNTRIIEAKGHTNLHRRVDGSIGRGLLWPGTSIHVAHGDGLQPGIVVAFQVIHERCR